MIPADKLNLIVKDIRSGWFRDVWCPLSNDTLIVIDSYEIANQIITINILQYYLRTLLKIGGYERSCLENSTWINNTYFVLSSNYSGIACFNSWVVFIWDEDGCYSDLFQFNSILFIRRFWGDSISWYF